MRSSLLSLALAPAAALGMNAPVTNDNPSGAVYQAIFPGGGDQMVHGSIVASSGPNGVGVVFAVNINGLPASGGPFPYHIHQLPVPADGNCTGTLAHLDPYNRGEMPPCDITQPDTCQVGDLAGKHGKLNGTSDSVTYTDDFPSLNPNDISFMGNRSIVIHYANVTSRLACANITVVSVGTVNGTSPSNSTSTAPYQNGTMTTSTSTGSMAVSTASSTAIVTGSATGGSGGGSTSSGAAPSQTISTGGAEVKQARLGLGAAVAGLGLWAVAV